MCKGIASIARITEKSVCSNYDEVYNVSSNSSMIKAVVDTTIMNRLFAISSLVNPLDCSWDPSDSWTFSSDDFSIMCKKVFTVQYVQLTVSKVHVNINKNKLTTTTFSQTCHTKHLSCIIIIVCVWVVQKILLNVLMVLIQKSLISIFQDSSIHQHE